MSDCIHGTCPYHEKNALLIDQHDRRLGLQDKDITSMSKNISKLNGMMVILISLIVILCGICGYVVVSFNTFQEKYNNDVINNTRIIGKIEQSVNINNNRIEQINDALDEIKENIQK